MKPSPSLLSRRGFIGGLFAAAPVVIASSRLMPLRGVRFDPIVRLQSWVAGQEVAGPFWVQEGPLSMMKRVEDAMRAEFGSAHYVPLPELQRTAAESRSPNDGLYGRDHMPIFRIGDAHGLEREDKPESDERFLANIRGWREYQSHRRATQDWVDATKVQQTWHDYYLKQTIEAKAQCHTIGHPRAEEILRAAGYDGSPAPTRQRAVELSDAVDQEMDRQTDEMWRRWESWPGQPDLPNPFPQRFKRVI
jgi:hypothetical protein